MSTIMTDDEIIDAIRKAGLRVIGPHKILSRAVEAAVLAKLEQQALSDHDPLIEQSLAALIDLICPDLDSGDIVRDAQEAMRELNKRAAAPEAPAQASEEDERAAFTVVYRNPAPEEVAQLIAHPKSVWIGWCHAAHERDEALAALAQKVQA